MKDKVIIITGAGSGIGQATAILAGSQGAKVIVSDVNQEGGEATVNEIIKNGGTASFIYCDVANKEDIKAIFAQTLSLHKKLDCLVNNAGIHGEVNLTHEYSDEMYEKVVAINQTGVFYCMKEGLRILHEQGNGGSIVNVSSLAGISGARNLSAYTASKHAVVGLTKAAAQEYGRFNIRINVICPAIIETPMADDLTMGDPASVEIIKQLIPMQRFGQPKEVAKSIVWLCSDDSSYINGQELRVDGGMKA
ncbi:MAG TPA: short-chain dehydrogenase [Microscillaceae bacterium]|nr:short-chain dehydrogenase [Microscillaceae bacterium]